MTDNSLSIQKKVYFALGSIFLLVMVVVISIAVSSERTLGKNMVHAQLQDKAAGYLDMMNMLMISGATANRELLREKIMSDASITEARMLRSPKIDALYGKGLAHEYPKDELDRRALNAMTQRFSDSLLQVVQSAEKLEAAAQHIDASSRRSKDAADQQNQETSQIQSSITTLHDSIRQVMNNAELSSDASEEAKAVARDGVEKTDQASVTIEQMNRAMQSTAEVITSLDERTANVGGVLEVIKGIAEQTNLLALNAAIEAARAGESGRGFAVVADEVRTLSQRTHDSAQEIETMIEQLQQEAKKAVSSMDQAQSTADEGVDRVKQAAQALHRMTAHVERMTELNSETLQRMQEQMRIGDNVTRGIDSIGQHSNNTVESADETTRVAGNLVSLANHLGTLVKQFKL